MNQLETLLNSLIKMGWKPWGILVDKILYIDSKFMLVCLDVIGGPKRQIKQDSLRELVSLESGFWQFCMEKGLCRKNGNNWSQYHIHPLEYELNYSSNEDYQYRLIESALVPEEELGKFLVDNIIVEGLKSEQSKR